MTGARASIHAGDIAVPDGRAKQLAPAAAYFAAFAVAVSLALWPTLRAMANVWLTSSAYHHGFLVAPAALWMAASTPAPAPRASAGALPLIAGAAMIWLVGEAAGAELIASLGFVCILIAGAAAIFGLACARAWAFPLAFLFFMAPFGESLLPLLQHAAARAVTALLNFSGVETTRDGVVLSTATGGFEIADACAGLNFLLAAAMVVAIYSWMTFRKPVKIILFAIIAITLALIVNILRAFVVIFLAAATDGKLNIADDHILFGWFFYGAMLVALIAGARRFADVREVPPRPAMREESPLHRRKTSLVFAGALALIALAAGYDRLVVLRAPSVAAPVSLPLVNAPGWSLAAPSRAWRPALKGADRRLYATYRSGAMQVFLAAGYFAYDRRGAEIAGYATRPDDGVSWRTIETLKAPLKAFGRSGVYRIDRMRGDDGGALDAIEVYWLGAQVFDSAVALKIAQAKARLQGRNPRGGVIFLAAPTEESATDIRAFLVDAEPLSVWLARIDARSVD